MVIADRYSQLFELGRVRPAVIADGLAELQIRWPSVPVVFCETRRLAQKWTYRFLAATHAWAITEKAALQRVSPTLLASANSMRRPHRRHRQPHRSAPGPATPGCRYPIAGGSAPRSGLPHTTPTRRTNPSAHSPYHAPPPDRKHTDHTKKVCTKSGMLQSTPGASTWAGRFPVQCELWWRTPSVPQPRLVGALGTGSDSGSGYSTIRASTSRRVAAVSAG